MTKPKDDAPAETADDATAKRQAYTEATSKLREAHRDEFNSLLGQSMAARNITWAPRPSEEDKARALLEATYAKYPHLAPQVETE